MESSQKKALIKLCLQEKILPSPEFLSTIENNFDPNILQKKIFNNGNKLVVLTTDSIKFIDSNINWIDFDKARVFLEKGQNAEIYKKFIDEISKQEKQNSQVKIIYSYKESSKKREVKDFVSYFNMRYKTLEKILRNRPELQGLTSITRLNNKKDQESVSIIGMVKEKATTSKGGIMLTVEDPTGFIKVYINNKKPDLFNPARDIILDEVIGIVGMNGDNILFANKLIWPEIPMNKELKKSPDEGYALFLSDIHIGSKNFLPNEFNQLLDWINGRLGNDEQKATANKIKYIFIIGDIIDGLGIYPGQEDELTIKSIKEQYDAAAELLKKIPSSIPIIICPGNHDAMRIAEPQPPLYKDFAEQLWNLQNVIMVSNPSMININSSEDFPGFDVLLYHGYSFDYMVANVDSIRNNGGYDRADLIMEYLLQRRHLAPAHTSTLSIPEVHQDQLVIEKIPDIFATGHIHKAAIQNYKNITLICGSCWQSKTAFQEKVGHNPEPARVPLLNLQTREFRLLKFGK